MVETNNFYINKPVHSDFLVHWTGEDIDKKFDPKWYLNKNNQSLTSPEGLDAYLERLKYILKYGLWMIKSNDGEKIKVNGKEFTKPVVARTCFTELQLSEARKHAKRFGRLGIGVKRYYVFKRLGGPMIYVQEGTDNILFPPYSQCFTGKDFVDKNIACSFLKHMCPPRKTPKYYKYFDESEWRIVYSDKLDGEYYTSPKSIDDDNFQAYRDRAKKKPKYLLHLDKWFAFIIYPSLHVKVAAEQKDSEIQKEIERLKPRLRLEATVDSTAGTGSYEKYSQPMGMDLDACRNF